MSLAPNGNPVSSSEELNTLLRRVAVLESENLHLACQLREAEAAFHDIVDNIPSVVSVTDAAFMRQVYVSPAYEKLWERSRDALYANPKSWLDAVHPDDLDRVKTSLQKPEAFNEEFRVLRGSGETRWVHIRLTSVRDGGGEIMRYVALTEDITDWKRLEAQLIQSQKMDAVGRLAGGIAHDFNNLLTVINGYSTMLIDRIDLADEVREDLGSIRKAGERAAALTLQLLAFSRKALTRPKVLVLSNAIASVQPMLRRLIREDVELITITRDPDTTIKADASQLEQVIVNLVINARDAITASGTITIETGKVHFDAEMSRLYAPATPGDYGMIAVSDTGCGISLSTQEHIFEPFFTTKEMGQGTGLGLATVYGIVKQSGGTIWVHSQVGVGTTFRIYLPAVESLETTQPAQCVRKAVGGSGTILLVEDDEQVRNIATLVLRKHGYTVSQASNGEDAVHVATSLGTIDLLVTDVIMPKISGCQLAAELAVLHPGMKVLFMSGYSDKAIPAAGGGGELNHLEKPFSPDDLARKVSEMLAADT